MYSTYESTVKEIIGIDGILYDNVEQVEPADPPEGVGLVAIERWKTARKKYGAASELYGVLLGQISEVSQTRLNETPRERERWMSAIP